MIVALPFSGVWAAEPENEAARQLAAERLDFMLGTVREFEVIPDQNATDRWRLYDKPVLRWSNPVAGIRDGIVVMWTDGERPAILAQVFPTKDNYWIHEFQSLAAGSFTLRDGERVLWEPRKAGGEFHRLADASPPADSAAKRLLQMRSLAREFSALDDFRIHHTDKEATRHELRLLSSPVYRYESHAGQVRDGAVFAFVLGTDPEVFLVLEAREDADGNGSWEYLFVPMTCWALEVKHKDRTVWAMDERFGKHSPRDVYHVWLPPVTFDR
jgi:hypothetical protein